MSQDDTSMPVVSLQQVQLHYSKGLGKGKLQALNDVSLDIPSACMVGIIGPDGVGKSSLLSLIAGAKAVQQGQVFTLGGDMRSKRHRDQIGPKIAYMPQGLGRNLYPTLSVEENLQFFARLFGHDAAERRRRIDELTKATGLFNFLQRPAGKLSGGMKQKLGLCCSLIHDPDLLILDEPTTGVDPLARSQFWQLIDAIRQQRPQMSVIVATAYMDEAQEFDWLVAMDEGQILATGKPQELLERTQTHNLEAAFVKLLPENKKRGHAEVVIPPLNASDGEFAIEAQGLTKRFGDFVAVDNVSFQIRRGEIFGFLGSNGCGKSVTMKMLTGLLEASEGKAWLFGQEVDPKDMATRHRVGYMSQAFSLYGELTVRQNLVLHARLFQVPEDDILQRVLEMEERFELAEVSNSLPSALPLGIRQRLSLAVAMVHKPELLILDEPTSGVDPVARDAFWRLLIELSRRDQVTIFISTHFMNEAERCDRMSMMHAGKVLDSDKPSELVKKRGAKNLEEAFIGYLIEADKTAATASSEALQSLQLPATYSTKSKNKNFSIQRLLSYSWRETLELQRDPVRAALALIGSVLLMLVVGFGINKDVSTLHYAVLDHDHSRLSESYQLSLSGSPYFVEHAPVYSYDELDRRMISGELSLVIEIPPGFGRNLARGRNVDIGAWFDGSMLAQAENIQGYVQGVHYHWLTEQNAVKGGAAMAELASIETRFRYNPDVKSMPAMVPATLVMILLMLPAMLAALAVVREKETGSIINFYVTPTTSAEFLIGKQLPYVVLAMVNFVVMLLLAITVFAVPVKGSYAALVAGATLFSFSATGMGMLISTLTKSQAAALFFALVGTMIPINQYSGFMDPVTSLEGVGYMIGQVYPGRYMIDISRGVFNKALSFSELQSALWPLLLAVPVIVGVAVLLQRKQER